MTAAPCAEGGIVTPPDAPAAERLRAPHVEAPATLAGDAIALGVVCLLFGRVADARLLGAWAAAVSLVWGLRLLHHLRGQRLREEADAPTPPGGRPLQRRWLLLAQGLLWGLAAWLFWGAGAPYHRVSLLLVLYTLCVAAALPLAAQPRVLAGFVAVVLAPLLARLVGDARDDGDLQFAALVAGLFVATVLLVRSHGSVLAQAMRLTARTEALTAQLHAEKADADAARRAAEAARAASQAQTRLLAAASHDLRQPLHAMTLFAQALRQRARDPDVASLAHELDDSVQALDGLFGELLDLTRIDAGGVEVRPGAVPMAELFTRLRLHYGPQAFEKGLALSFRGARHVAHADPLLLERILRNLLANAIRYTDDGGILVACRARQGRLLLQVWDTGIGIPAESLPRVFDEFYQAHVAPGSASARQGSGLGLAIVRRLAALIGAPIAVRSRVGRGTVFSLVVPVAGRAAPTAAARARAAD